MVTDEHGFAVATDVATPDVYMMIGDMMISNDEILQVRGKYRTRKFRKWQLYLQALNHGPSDMDAELYVKLALSLPASQNVAIFRDKRRLTRKDMYLLALDLDPTLADPYVEIVKDDPQPLGKKFRLLNGTEYTLRDMMTLVVSLDANIASAYYYLGMTLSDDKKRLRVQLHRNEKESVFSRREFFVACLDLDPCHAAAHAALVAILRDDEGGVAIRSAWITKREMCIMGLTLKQPLCSTYLILASILRDDEMVQLKNGSVVTKMELLLQATTIDPLSVRAYQMLAYTMRSLGIPSTIINGKDMSIVDIGFYLIKLDSKLASAYDLLASQLHGPDDYMYMPRDKHTTMKVTKWDLYELAIECDKTYARAYYNLATLLPQLSYKITLKDGRMMSQLDLYLQVIHLDGTFARAYNNIAVQLISPTEKVPLHNGNILSKKELFIMAIAMDPSLVIAYHNLAALMQSPTEKVTLKDGRCMTMEQLLHY